MNVTPITGCTLLCAPSLPAEPVLKLLLGVDTFAPQGVLLPFALPVCMGVLCVCEGISVVVRVCVSAPSHEPLERAVKAEPPVGKPVPEAPPPVPVPTPIGTRPRRSGTLKCVPSTEPYAVLNTAKRAAYVPERRYEAPSHNTQSVGAEDAPYMVIEPTGIPPPAGAANVPSPLKKVVVLFGGVGTPPPTVAVIVATLPVAMGVLNVCTPVNVFAASVLAIVAEVEGNVIVVESVPARVKVLLDVRVFPSAIVSVAEVAGAVTATLFTEVAVATPNVGVVKLGEVKRFATVIDLVVVAEISSNGIKSATSGAAPRAVSSLIFWSAISS